MATEDLDNIIEDILEGAIERLKDAYDSRKESLSPNFKSNKNGCRLVFPIKRDKQTRVSEQELRFAFVEAFNDYYKNEDKNKDKPQLFYSVETPTRDPYSGFSTSEPHVDPNGQSGNIDLVIHDEKGERVCLIEFKAHSAGYNDYLKDFVKLDNPEESKRKEDKKREENNGKRTLRYFINIFEKVDDGTLNTLRKKIKKSDEYTSGDEVNYKEEKVGKTIVYYITLEGEPQEPKKI